MKIRNTKTKPELNIQVAVNLESGVLVLGAARPHAIESAESGGNFGQIWLLEPNGKDEDFQFAIYFEQLRTSQLSITLTLATGESLEVSVDVHSDYSNPKLLRSIFLEFAPLTKAVVDYIADDVKFNSVALSMWAIQEAATNDREDLVGYFDQVHAGCAEGWAYDPTAKAARLAVQIWCNGNIVSEGNAAIPRSDLIAQKIGDGNYRFQIPLGKSVLDGETHQLIACVKNTAFVLNGSPMEFNSPVPGVSPPLTSVAPMEPTGTLLLGANHESSQLSCPSKASMINKEVDVVRRAKNEIALMNELLKKVAAQRKNQ